MTEHDVFISYRRLDTPRVDSLVEALRAQGLSVWLDRADITDYAAITRAITEGLAQSKAVLAWYSKHYPLSRPCQWELTAAYLAAQQGGDPRQRVLIVNPETSPDHIALPELKNQQYLSAPAKDDQAGYDDLAKRIAAQVRVLEVDHSDTTLAAWNILLTLRQEGLHELATLLAQEYLAWLAEVTPETLSAIQNRRRDCRRRILQHHPHPHQKPTHPQQPKRGASHDQTCSVNRHQSLQYPRRGSAGLCQ